MRLRIRLMLDGDLVEFYVQPKHESWHQRFIGKLPGVPRTYMTAFWTTIGDTVYVPSPRVTPDFGSALWLKRHILTMRHEARHVQSWRRLTWFGFLTKYFGPSVTLGLPALLSTLCVGLLMQEWVPLIIAAACFVLLLPLTVGYAYGRAIEEWDAYEESVLTYGGPYARFVAQSLWDNYFWTIPPRVTEKHFGEKLRAARPQPESGPRSDVRS